ncbi:MAG: hypothetical protein HRU11_15085, partial [Parvularculaceae bacterium]|nr:hypothetical protein [Parvularculaceae bacterium]
YPAATEFSGKVDEVAGSGDPRTGSPLVAFGGGKDSYVAGTIAEMAFGEQPTFASVILADTVGAVLTRTAPHPPRLIKRRLDPKLLSLNGAFNGHVPITAINILVLTIVGLLEGRGPILFANERSADEPTMVLAHGTEANHQYSKSSAFEKLVRQAVTEVSPSAPQVFSVLRPFSELWIGQQFAKIESAFGRFTSCNRNFRLASDADKRWCGACAKCAFTSLILAPFISREQALTIFGRIMLDQQALLPFYRELLGLSEQKPWDCVGTISESQAALYLASKKADWDTTLVMRELLPELMQLTNPESLDRQATDALKAEPAGALPRDLYQAAMEMSS